MTEKYYSWYLRIFGMVYAVLALLGFIIGIVRMNIADNLLHTSVAIAFLAVGFGMKSDAHLFFVSHLLVVRRKDKAGTQRICAPIEQAFVWR